MAEVRVAQQADFSKSESPRRLIRAGAPRNGHSAMTNNDPDRDNGHDQGASKGDNYWQTHRRKVLEEHGLDGGDE